MYTHESIKPYDNKGKKTEQVHRMFDNIAHSYDALNHTLSLGIDKLWRRIAISTLAKSNSKTRKILDIGTGTGDFAIMACKKFKDSHVTATDISLEMMQIGKQKVKDNGLEERITFMEADCQNLPFGDNSFDTIISAFVLRNFSDLNKCLSEMLRVLDNNGRITVIDLCQPVGFPMKQLFNIYENTIIPTLGKIISKDKKAYTYLPQTMKSVPQGNDMKKILEKAGFKNVEYKRLPFGMCILYEATK